MKFTVKQADLLKATSHVQSIVERKTTVPILSNVKMTVSDGKLILHATDMEIELAETIDVEVEEEGTATTPAHTLYEIVKKLPSSEDIEFTLTENQIDLKAGRSRFSLSILASDEFPVLKQNEYTGSFEIDTESVSYLINKSRFAISTEETRYYLNGIYMHASDNDTEDNKVLRVVATDGHRLARVEVELPEGAENLQGIIVPRKTVHEIFKLSENFEGNIKISFNETLIKFEMGSITITSKLIDGSFPDYQRVIPKNNNKLLELEAVSFAKSVDRVSTVSLDRSRAIKLEIQDNQLTLVANSVSNNQAEEDMEVTWENGEEFSIGFNGKYLLDIINQIEDETVQITFGQSTEPAILRDVSDDSLLYVLMPMRV